MNQRQQRDWLALAGNIGICLLVLLVLLLPIYIHCTHSKLSFNPEKTTKQPTKK